MIYETRAKAEIHLLEASAVVNMGNHNYDMPEGLFLPSLGEASGTKCLEWNDRQKVNATPPRTERAACTR
jgi:hypothetical protein